MNPNGFKSNQVRLSSNWVLLLLLMPLASSFNNIMWFSIFREEKEAKQKWWSSFWGACIGLNEIIWIEDQSHFKGRLILSLWRLWIVIMNTNHPIFGAFNRIENSVELGFDLIWFNWTFYHRLSTQVIRWNPIIINDGSDFHLT